MHSANALKTSRNLYVKVQIAEGEMRNKINKLVHEVRQNGMRSTVCLQKVLAEFLQSHHPVSHADLCDKPALRRWDRVTIYRLLIKLETIGIIRRVSITGRTSYFQLTQDSESPCYLICRRCGDVTTMEVSPSLKEAAVQMFTQTEWKNMDYELKLHGVCSQCDAR